MSEEKKFDTPEERTESNHHYPWGKIVGYGTAVILVIVAALFLYQTYDSMITDYDTLAKKYDSLAAQAAKNEKNLKAQIKAAKNEIRLTSIIHRDLLPFGVSVVDYSSYVTDSTKSASSYVRDAMNKVGKDFDLAQDRVRDVLYAAKKLKLEKVFAKILAKGIAWTQSLPWDRAVLRDTVIYIDEGDGNGYDFPCKVFVDDSLAKNAEWPERHILRNPNLYNQFLALADSVGRQLVGDEQWNNYLAQAKTNTKPVVVPSTPQTSPVIKKQKTEEKQKTAQKRKFRRLPRRRR